MMQANFLRRLARVNSSRTTRACHCRWPYVSAERAYSSRSTDHVRIVEVGPRDGLQDERLSDEVSGDPLVTTADKIEFINMLYDSGCRHIEAGAFVSPKRVPAMADSFQVMQGLRETLVSPNNSSDGLVLSCLVPNLPGWEKAVQVAPDEIAVFVSASEGFSQNNLQCSVAESIERYSQVAQALHKHNNNNKPIRLRGYVSCVIACPYDGPIQPIAVAKAIEQLIELGCQEISLGDTIGVGTAGTTKRLLDEIVSLSSSAAVDLAVHFHDTYGQALTNILTSLESDIRVVDAAAAGLGGCPYAKGATGNVATEDVVYMLNGLGMDTGICLESLAKAGAFICDKLGRPSQSRAGRAVLAKLSQLS